MRHERPTGRQLFRTCLLASVIGGVVGGLALYGCWAATDFDADAGREFAYFGNLLGVVLIAAVVLHYPWNRRWAAASGCRVD